MSPESKLRLALLFLVLIVSIGTIGYSVIEHWSVFDSLFMTIITLSTVGYGVVRPLSEAGEIFTMFLIVFGAFNGGLIVAALAQLILEGQLLTILGKRKMEKKVQRLKNHIILCGFGRRLDVPFVIIEKEIVNIPEPGASDMMFIQGDVADDDVLEQARIRQARAIVSTLPDDADNVYLALTARQINPGMVIIARAESDLAKRKLHRAGADRVISPHELGGMQMAMATLRPNVVDFMRLAAIDPSHQGLSIEEIPIRPGSTLAGQSLIEAAIKTQYDIIVVGLRKNSGSVVFNPPGETVMEPGDILVALGETDKLERLGADLG
jgi:voltage-gated potassium channel